MSTPEEKKDNHLEELLQAIQKYMSEERNIFQFYNLCLNKKQKSGS